YTSVTSEKVDPESSGVMIHKPGEAHPGYNLYCCERCPDIFLIDMTGEIVHRWTYPGRPGARWHHAILLPDGDIVAVAKEPNGLMRLDWNSDVVWEKAIAAHHDVVLAPDKTLYAIAGEKKMYRDLEVEFPSILHMTLDGDTIDTWSAFEHLDAIKETFDQSWFLDTILDSMMGQRKRDRMLDPIVRRAHRTGQPTEELVYDYFHMNTVGIIPETPLGESDPRFKPGNLLICFRNVNQVAILDKVTGEILWVWGEGIVEWPHHPTMLEDGNILIFDNGSRRGYSKVLEIDPVTGAIEWEYAGVPMGSFYSFSRGSAQRLPNGNTLICEGDEGRVFEVNRAGEIVWKWLNSTTPEGYREQVYRMIRIPPDEVEPLLSEQGTQPGNP
ncbi:arylsulfotransferase family protein, partial [Candidatus Eisenbacteria bacterium]